MNVVVSRLSLRFVTRCGCLQRADVSVLRDTPPAPPPPPNFGGQKFGKTGNVVRGCWEPLTFLALHAIPKQLCENVRTQPALHAVGAQEEGGARQRLGELCVYVTGGVANPVAAVWDARVAGCALRAHPCCAGSTRGEARGARRGAAQSSDRGAALRGSRNGELPCEPARRGARWHIRSRGRGQAAGADSVGLLATCCACRGGCPGRRARRSCGGRGCSTPVAQRVAWACRACSVGCTWTLQARMALVPSGSAGCRLWSTQRPLAVRDAGADISLRGQRGRVHHQRPAACVPILMCAPGWSLPAPGALVACGFSCANEERGCSPAEQKGGAERRVDGRLTVFVRVLVW